MLSKGMVKTSNFLSVGTLRVADVESAGIVGEDPGVSGRFQSGITTESSPPSGASSRLCKLVDSVKGDGLSRCGRSHGAIQQFSAKN